MNELISKISSYNLFNNFFPGIVFAGIITKVTHYNLIQDNLLVGLFFYYFIGLIISRFGSIVIEPILKGIGIIKFANYKDFIQASIKDIKIELLSEVNNTYRTITSMLVLILIIMLYEKIGSSIEPLYNLTFVVVLIIILILFIFSFKKQTKYLKKRIDSANNK